MEEYSYKNSCYFFLGIASIIASLSLYDYRQRKKDLEMYYQKKISGVEWWNIYYTDQFNQNKITSDRYLLLYDLENKKIQEIKNDMRKDGFNEREISHTHLNAEEESAYKISNKKDLHGYLQDIKQRKEDLGLRGYFDFIDESLNKLFRKKIF